MQPWCRWSSSSRVVETGLLLVFFVLLSLSLFGVACVATIPPAASPGKRSAGSVFEPDQGTVSAPPAKEVDTRMGSSVWKMFGRPRQSRLDTHGGET